MSIVIVVRVGQMEVVQKELDPALRAAIMAALKPHQERYTSVCDALSGDLARLKEKRDTNIVWLKISLSPVTLCKAVYYALVLGSTQMEHRRAKRNCEMIDNLHAHLDAGDLRLVHRFLDERHFADLVSGQVMRLSSTLDGGDPTLQLGPGPQVQDSMSSLLKRIRDHLGTNTLII